MIVAGAGGHALELLDILISQGKDQNLFFYDDINDLILFKNRHPVIHKKEDLKQILSIDSEFLLGTGNPKTRNYFYNLFKQMGGIHISIKGKGIAFSNFSKSYEADIFNLCFIGADTEIGKGTLINTGAQVHHEVKIGEFCDINPGAVLLGKCEIGDLSNIGANSTILPKISIGKNVIVGAGSVVTKNVPDDCIVVGVPARIIEKLE